MNKLLIFLVFITLNTSAFSQINKAEYTYLKSQIPKETVKLETNASIIMAGEYLYYKTVSFNTKTNNYSNISKMTYVALVGFNNNIVFSHKLKTKNGIAQSEFFIPTSIKTGHYKLVGYTNWSKNNETERFDELDIFIINPYSLEKQEIPLKMDIVNPSTEISLKPEVISDQTIYSDIASINLNKSQFGAREKVTIDITSSQTNSINYSLSVRKMDAIQAETNAINTITKSAKNETYFLPELRGEIISGKIEALDGKSAVENIPISLSFAGENSIFKNAKTNTAGHFYFTMDGDYDNKNMTLQIQSSNKENFQIILDEKNFDDYELLHFNQLHLNSNINEWLTKQSINNQIENAYFSIKADSLEIETDNTPFYSSNLTTYLLDDYTRFKTVKETFIEIVTSASISKKDSTHIFKVPDYENLDYKSDLDYLQPLVIVDGLLIQDNEDIINYSSFKIESISTLPGLYIYGPVVYNGVIIFKTKERDFKITDEGAYIKNIVFKNVVRNKLYYQPNYEAAENLSRIPDYRKQLLWVPNLTIEKGQKTISFFTSDNQGVYEIILRGLTPTGKIIKTTRYFKVN